MISSQPKRGEIWWVRFDPTKGEEIQKTRPALVISADGLSTLRVRLVIPITAWKPQFTNIPWMVKITPSQNNGLDKASAANPLHTRSVSLERFSQKIGVLEGTTVEEVVLALAIVIQSQ